VIVAARKMLRKQKNRTIYQKLVHVRDLQRNRGRHVDKHITFLVFPAKDMNRPDLSTTFDYGWAGLRPVNAESLC